VQQFLQWKSKKYYIFRECLFVALGIPREMRMRHIIHGLSGSTIFSHNFLTHGTIFEKNLLNIKCVVLFSLQFLCERFCIIRRTERVMIKTVYRCSREVPSFLCDFNET
jgi:hypothetical protein